MAMKNPAHPGLGLRDDIDALGWPVGGAEAYPSNPVSPAEPPKLTPSSPRGLDPSTPLRLVARPVGRGERRRLRGDGRRGEVCGGRRAEIADSCRILGSELVATSRYGRSTSVSGSSAQESPDSDLISIYFQSVGDGLSTGDFFMSVCPRKIWSFPCQQT